MSRVHVILAREAPFGVIFRRGPSKQVLLISWDTETDTFAMGQWFKGHIYERRCDLSPSGDLLLYFASKQKPPYSTWSAVSRPPFLTALALWPQGHTYGGGGLFEDDTHIAFDGDHSLADGFALPQWLRLGAFEERISWAQDDAVWEARLLHEGWLVTSDEFREKRHPVLPNRYTLKMTLSESFDFAGDQMAHHVVSNSLSLGPGKSDWADWDRTGDLLFSKRAALYRVRFSNGVLAPIEEAQQLSDFSTMRFENVVAPQTALQWPVR